MKILLIPTGIILFLLVSPLLRAKEEDPRDRNSKLLELAAAPDIDWYKVSRDLINSGCSEGDVFEALITRFSILGNVNCLVAFMPMLDKQNIELPFGEDRFFNTVEQRDSFLAGLRAIIARKWGKLDDMKQYASECFNLDRRMFAILDLKSELEEAIDDSLELSFKGIIPLDTKLKSVEGKDFTIRELCEKNNAVLLDFWASWCRPCLDRMPELKERFHRYSKKRIYVAAVNTDSQDQLNAANQTRERYEMDIPWLLEPTSDPISGPLKITSIPRVVVLNKQGDVLYNGHPDNAELEILLLDLSIGIDQ